MKPMLAVCAFALLLLVDLRRSPAADPALPQLKVALFGYVPDADAAAARLQEAFAAQKTGYTLCVTPLDPYHDKDTVGSIPTLQHFADFDVVETDLCRLEDLRDGKIGLETLPKEWTWYPTPAAASGSAKAIVSSLDFKKYAVPHWICQNFVIRWTGSPPTPGAGPVQGLDAGPGRPVLGDFWGTTGLGEFYAGALANKCGPVNAENSLRALAAKAAKLPPDVTITVADLDRPASDAVLTLAAKLPGPFRSHLSYYHSHPELYAWEFASNRKAVFIGYSESLFYTQLSGDASNPASPHRPIGPADVSIKPLNFCAKGAQGTPSWTDGFVIPKGKLAGKKLVIEQFIKFATTPTAYACFEQPEAGLAAANLLPAYEAVYTDPGTIRDEPLLREFHDRFDASFVIDHSQVWRGMKQAGSALEDALQPSN